MTESLNFTVVILKPFLFKRLRKRTNNLLQRFICKNLYKKMNVLGEISERTCCMHTCMHTPAHVLCSPKDSRPEGLSSLYCYDRNDG